MVDQATTVSFVKTTKESRKKSSTVMVVVQSVNNGEKEKGR